MLPTSRPTSRVTRMAPESDKPTEACTPTLPGTPTLRAVFFRKRSMPSRISSSFTPGLPKRPSRGQIQAELRQGGSRTRSTAMGARMMGSPWAANLGRHGKPAAFYSDKHSIFRVNQEGASGRAGGITQFGRALGVLNIDIICANTPQAKGRVERMNKTLQDRLVKEMRLRGISSMAGANAYAPEFMEDYNRRFARAPMILTMRTGLCNPTRTSRRFSPGRRSAR
jgi:hypothetical protein